MSTTVNYKGNTIATLENETKKLTTKGTWLEDDIEIVDVSNSGVVWQDSNGLIHLSDTASNNKRVSTGTFTPSERILTKTIDTNLTNVTNLVIIPTSTTPLLSNGKTIYYLISSANDYVKSIAGGTNQAGSGSLTPTISTSSTLFTQSGTEITVTSNSNIGYFETIEYTWYAW